MRVLQHRQHQAADRQVRGVRAGGEQQADEREALLVAQPLALDPADQAIWSRSGATGVVHRSDRGSQYLYIRYSERLVQAGVEPIGNVPPAELEMAYYRQQDESAMAA